MTRNHLWNWLEN